MSAAADFRHSPYAERSRARKAGAIAATLLACGVTVRKAAAFGPLERKAAARLGGQRDPSEETWRLALERLRELRKAACAAGVDTGYWGMPGTSRVTKVHLRVGGRDGRPACGIRLADAMEFQWCAHGVYWRYVECERCKQWWRQKIEG